MANTKSILSVLSFGEILWDIIQDQKYIGGAPLNFAAHVVKCGGTSAVISAVGNDDLGRKAIQTLVSLGIDQSYVQVCRDKPTGTVDVFLSHGQPDYTIHENVAFDFISSTDVSKISAGKYNTFYFGSLAQRSEISRNTLQWILTHYTFDHIFYDINLRKNYYSTAIIQYSLQHCTIFKINDDEVQTISKLFYLRVLPMEKFARRIAIDFQITIVIVTAGANGCYVLAQEKFEHIPAFATTVVDAVGAGDAFSAAFMYQYYKSNNVNEAALLGNRVGAYVASRNGAIPEYSNEIKTYL